MLILALESSTTSAKAMLYSTEDGIVDLVTKEYLPEYNDTQSQDADGVFMQTAQVGKQVCAGRKIDCIVLSGVWHSLVLCDKEMKPKIRVLSWANTSAADISNELRSRSEEAAAYYKKTGCLVNAIYPSFKLLYLKKQEYQLEDYYIFGQGSYNTYRLTGKRIVTDSMVSGSGLFNIHERRYDKDILNWIDIKEDQLCEIVTYKDAVPLSTEGAKLLGLVAGIPVIPPCADGALNQVGVGAMDEGIMTCSVGTSAALRLTTAKPLMPEEPSTWCYLSPKSWLIGAATSGACNSTDWFKNNFYNSSYAEIEKNSYAVKDTPVFLPFLFGERSPGWHDDNRGAFVGIQPWHTKVELYQAVQEGILYNLYQCYEILCKLNGKPKKIILSGGILKSEFWTQMCVDIFETDMYIPDTDQSSLMGAVVLALERMGAISDIKDFPFDKERIVKADLTKRDRYVSKYKRYRYWYDKMI